MRRRRENEPSTLKHQTNDHWLYNSFSNIHDNISTYSNAIKYNIKLLTI